jgi:hypothetical protein
MPLAMDLDIPTAYETRIVCCMTAAIEYSVPADILLAIAEIEGGKPGIISRNSNGTVDIGPMQFNSSYLASLRNFGILPEDVNAEGCYPYRLAAWRVLGHITRDQGDVFTRAANYHSRTPQYNTIYRAKLITAARRWAGWLKTKFNFAPIK